MLIDHCKGEEFIVTILLTHVYFEKLEFRYIFYAALRQLLIFFYIIPSGGAMISKILVTTDDSKIAKKAFKYSMDLAGQLKASITLLTVIHDTALITESVPAELSHLQIMAPVENYLRTAAERYLKKAETLCRKRRIKCRSVIRNGNPVDEIIKEAKRSKADVIVMGSHGKGMLESAVLGSVTYGVIHKNTKFPVLVIR